MGDVRDAKAIRFFQNFGGGSDVLLRCTPEQAQRILDQFGEAYPKVVEFHHEVQERLTEDPDAS